MDFSEIDFSKWTKAHWSLFSSLAVGFFMWGIIASIAPIFYPQVNQVWFLVVPIIAQLVGDLAISRLSDIRLGRKGTFFLTMGLYGTGALIIFGVSQAVVSGVISTSSPVFLPLVVLGIILGYLGIEGEVPTALSYAGETMPLSLRETMLVFLPNFDNMGAMVAAAISYLTYYLSSSYLLELRTLGILAIVMVGFAIVMRYLTPESVRWLVKAGKREEAEKEIEKYFSGAEVRHVTPRGVNEVSLGFRYAFLSIIGVSQYLTYGLMAYTIADYYFKGIVVDEIVFIANLGASIAGIIASFLVKYIPTRKFAVFSFLGGTLTMIPILLLISGLVPFSLGVFYVLLLFNMAFSEFGWATRTVLEPLLMPIKSRAFYIGLIRVAPMLAYAGSLYLTSGFSSTQFVIYNLGLWALGLGGSLAWYYKGYDTNMIPIEETAGDTTYRVK
ncbi:MFS transporter [Acidianus ambivalens]|uniref:MFS transporter n=1 Tax=Acidianus ambivalens TaxID=2283 RepID=A0A650CW17_ACIAM|nr:MFS transporter [Acidianus ambivalens]MQL55527.1 MFS transporter [Acidianus ambivalens]QGR21885.1 MFS transporter [Acidianus ambivalens]